MPEQGQVEGRGMDQRKRPSQLEVFEHLKKGENEVVASILEREIKEMDFDSVDDIWTNLDESYLFSDDPRITTVNLGTGESSSLPPNRQLNLEIYASIKGEKTTVLVEVNLIFRGKIGDGVAVLGRVFKKE